MQVQRREEGGDDEGEEGVSDDADALGEGAMELFVLARVGQWSSLGAETPIEAIGIAPQIRDARKKG